MITASKLQVIDPKQPSVGRAWRECVSETGYSKEDLAGPRGLKKLTYARFKAYRIFRELGFSLPEIGHQFNRDHSSIIHGLRRLEQL